MVPSSKPAKENMHNKVIFCIFGPWKNWPEMAQMGPGGFFPTNPDLADIWGDTDSDFDNCYFWDLLDPRSLDFQVPRFQNF